MSLTSLFHADNLNSQLGSNENRLMSELSWKRKDTNNASNDNDGTQTRQNSSQTGFLHVSSIFHTFQTTVF